ncbi:MAG TPA: zinc-binding dehydrogenase [Stellaceae bacterium]|nr:zinc-binding dehydrogenase [Stellaceae bacterium]
MRQTQAIPETFLGVGYTRDRAGLPLEAVRVPVPRPATDEVLIRVAASSLNPLEYKLADLNFMGRTPPVVLGLDLSGVVVAAGHDVQGVAVGDAVTAMADLNGNGGWSATGESGGEGGYAVARDFLTVRKPPSLSFRDAAALPMCFLSAFAGIYGTVQTGDTVYIPGGGGGVGHLAVQMAARALGAGLVISSGSTPQSIALARQSGAHHVFDYKRDDIAAEIAKLTSGRGVDLVFDATYSEAGFVETAKTVRQGGSWNVLGVGPGKTTRLVETHTARSMPSWLSAAPSVSTSICCATFPNPPRSTARRRLFSSAGWLWRWSGRRRDWWSRTSARPSTAALRRSMRGCSH